MAADNGLFVGEVTVDPTADDLEETHALRVFFPEQVDESILLALELEQTHNHLLFNTI